MDAAFAASSSPYGLGPALVLDWSGRERLVLDEVARPLLRAIEHASVGSNLAVVVPVEVHVICGPGSFCVQVDLDEASAQTGRVPATRPICAEFTWSEEAARSRAAAQAVAFIMGMTPADVPAAHELRADDGGQVA